MGISRCERSAGTDTALAWTIVLRSGQPTEIRVDCTAVRQSIERCQPLLSLYGHIHEHKSGRIPGVVAELAPRAVLAQAFVVG